MPTSRTAPPHAPPVTEEEGGEWGWGSVSVGAAEGGAERTRSTRHRALAGVTVGAGAEDGGEEATGGEHRAEGQSALTTVLPNAGHSLAAQPLDVPFWIALSEH